MLYEERLEERLAFLCGHVGGHSGVGDEAVRTAFAKNTSSLYTYTHTHIPLVDM